MLAAAGLFTEAVLCADYLQLVNIIIKSGVGYRPSVCVRYCFVNGVSVFWSNAQILSEYVWKSGSCTFQRDLGGGC